MHCNRRGARTVPLMKMTTTMMMVVAVARGAVPERQDAVVEMLPVELEASMQSSVLAELRAAAAAVGEGPAAEIPGSSAKNGGVHTGIPDCSAVVGQVFQLRVPPGPANTTCDVHVSDPKVGSTC